MTHFTPFVSLGGVYPGLFRGGYDGTIRLSLEVKEGSIERDHGLLLTMLSIREDQCTHQDSILSALSNVSVTLEEFQERIDFDSDPTKYSCLDENGYLNPKNYVGDTPHWNLITTGMEYYSQEEQGKVYYTWGDGEVYTADSYSDITIVERYDGTGSKEYYSTPEIIEVLKQWLDYLERWNDPIERQKMIDEFEANEKKKTTYLGKIKNWIQRYVLG